MSADEHDQDLIDRMREMVVFLAKALVDEPDAVDVTVVEAARATIYELTVDESDLGKVIGREGRTARAIRQMLSAGSAGLNKRAVLDIIE